MNIKWTKLRLSKKYDRIRPPAFAFEQNTKSLEKTGQAFLGHALTFSITGRTTFWSISHEDFFLPELSTIFLWPSLDFQPPWHLQEIKKVFRKSYVYEIWLIIHYSLDSGWWLCRHPEHELPTRCLLSSLWPFRSPLGKFSFVILQPFSFKHSPNINLVNSEFFGIFVKLTWSFSIAALTSCFVFLFPLVSFTASSPLPSCFSVTLGSPSSEEPCKPWIWPLPTAWRVWQWNLCQADN